MNRQEMQQKATRFIRFHRGQNSGLAYLLDEIKRRKWRVVLFGGVLRDLVWRSPSFRPRDVDLVVEEIGADAIEDVFGTHVVRKTRFGGYQLRFQGWDIDLWPLRDTWGLQHRSLGPSFSNLTLTTFLNVEAIAAVLDDNADGVAEVFEHGFFDAMERECLDVNMEDNPYPLLCAVKTFATAAKVNFMLSERLARFLVEQMEVADAAELEDVQEKHYGHVLFTAGMLRSWASELGRLMAAPVHKNGVRMNASKCVRSSVWSNSPVHASWP